CDEVPAGRPQSLVDRERMSAVDGMGDHAQSAVGERLDDLARIVRRRVVDQDDLPIEMATELQDAVEAVWEEAGVVIAGHHETDHGRALITRAGTPAAVTWAGKSSTTTAPAPTMVHSPTDTLSMTVAPAPI